MPTRDTSPPQAGVVGRQLDASGNWAVFGFGNIGASGTKSAVVPAEDGNGHLTLYCMESPECWFEDFGSARLSGGSASVRIDPEFAQTVHTAEYHVFVQAEGNCRGLFVQDKTATGFVVQELERGREQHVLCLPDRGPAQGRVRTAAAPGDAARRAGPQSRLAYPGERARLAVIAAGVQPDDPAITDRDNVIGPVVGPPAAVLVESWRAHHQDHLVTGGDDLFKLGPQPQFGLPAQGLLQFLAAAADLRLRVCQAWVEVGPLQAWVHEVHHSREVAPVVGQECLADDPLVLVTHPQRLTMR